MYVAKGKIIQIDKTIKISERLSRRYFVIQNFSQDEKHSSTMAFYIKNSKSILLDFHRLGDLVEVWFNVKSYQNKTSGIYYTNLKVFDIKMHFEVR